MPHDRPRRMPHDRPRRMKERWIRAQLYALGAVGIVLFAVTEIAAGRWSPKRVDLRAAWRALRRT